MNEVLARFQSIFLARARLVASVFVVFACFAFASTGQARAETVVSLTFDDGIATQYNLARPLLASHGMHGTFFINSGNVGTDLSERSGQRAARRQEAHDLTSRNVAYTYG